MRELIFKINLIISLAVLTAGTSNAQIDSLYVHPGVRNYGYIILPAGDTVTGYILNLNLWNNQMMTIYFTDLVNGGKGTKYRAKELTGYKVGCREYEQLKFAGLYSPYKYNFFLRKMEGAIDYYVWYYNNDVNTLLGTDVVLTEASDAMLINEADLWTQVLGRTEKGEIIELGSMKFKHNFDKHMSRLVEDYPALAEKIRNKEEGYQYQNLESIIREYNSWKAAH
jgi:hypothetical protein